MTPALDYLVIGHVARDETPDGPQPGGTAAYSARVAQALGLRVGVLTSAHPADPVLPALDGLDIHLIPAESSTIFVNQYSAAGRQQIVRGHARVLSYAHVPEAWRDAPVVHFGPITPELEAGLLPTCFPGALVGVTPQGFMRAWGADGVVYPVPWAGAAAMLPHAVTVLSDEDLGHDPALEARYAARAHALVVTRNFAGATLYRAGARQDFPAPSIERLCHPTGAGDVFAAALFSMLHHAPDDWEVAMHVAVNVASTFVETCASPGVPTRAELEAVLAAPRVRAVLPG